MENKGYLGVKFSSQLPNTVPREGQQSSLFLLEYQSASKKAVIPLEGLNMSLIQPESVGMVSNRDSKFVSLSWSDLFCAVH